MAQGDRIYSKSLIKIAEISGLQGLVDWLNTDVDTGLKHNPKL